MYVYLKNAIFMDPLRKHLSNPEWYTKALFLLPLNSRKKQTDNKT